MGGCCCCASRGPRHNRTSSFYYLPRVLEGRHLSSHHGSGSALSTGLLVDTNFDTSIPSSYMPPPIPIPYNMDMGNQHTPPYIQQIRSIKGNTALQTPNSSMSEIVDSGGVIETTIEDRDLKKMDGKVHKYLDISSEKLKNRVILAQSESVSSLEEEDSCPTCLEEYNEENPKIVAKCEHHFHLACILEWMERSESCPVCDKEMVFTTNIP